MQQFSGENKEYIIHLKLHKEFPDKMLLLTRAD